MNGSLSVSAHDTSAKRGYNFHKMVCTAMHIYYSCNWKRSPRSSVELTQNRRAELQLHALPDHRLQQRQQQQKRRQQIILAFFLKTIFDMKIEV